MKKYKSPTHQLEKRRKWPVILAILVMVVALGVWYVMSGQLFEDVLNSDYVQKQVEDRLGVELDGVMALLPEVLGIYEPKTYLILFLNNTELRPGGGFIGVYATIRVEHGNVEILKVEGTEKIDRNTPISWNPRPPQILTDHLKVDTWYFRDSNWSPDFALSSQKSLELYTGEEGVAADDIDAVIGITTTVLEELLRITGPMTVQGIYFDADNVIEKLEYEVEYGYDDKGLHFLERKQIIEPFMNALLAHVKQNVFKNLNVYKDVAEKLIEQKHIMAYSMDDTLQTSLEEFGLDGQMKETDGDYLMWVDANLAALKTDHAITRDLTYTITPRPAAHESERTWYIGTAEMTYQHTGSFDWRTSRYRSYARVYVPLGSTLISHSGSMVWDRSDEPDIVDQGIEHGKQWFGAFISIEPGETKTLSFSYALSADIQKDIYDGSYILFVQKQLGTLIPGLTLGLDFDTTITSAKPAEVQTEWGDDMYRIKSDLEVDRGFEVLF